MGEVLCSVRTQIIDCLLSNLLMFLVFTTAHGPRCIELAQNYGGSEVPYFDKSV